MTAQPYEPAGDIPACLMPFDADLRIDEEAYRSHLRDLLLAAFPSKYSLYRPQLRKIGYFPLW